MGDVEANIRAAQNHYTNEITRALIAGTNKDDNGFYAHIRNAEAIKQLIPETKWKETENAADRANLSLQARIDKKYWIDLHANLQQYLKVQETK